MKRSLQRQRNMMAVLGALWCSGGEMYGLDIMNESGVRCRGSLRCGGDLLDIFESVVDLISCITERRRNMSRDQAWMVIAILAGILIVIGIVVF